MGDILKEAIADAKAVRETALANAKMALEEAFTPQLKSMLSAKLREEDDEYDDEETFDEDEDFGGEDEYEDEDGDDESFEDEEEVEETIEVNGKTYSLVSEEDDEEGEEDVDFGDDEEEGEELDLEAIIKELENELSEEDDAGDDDEFDGGDDEEEFEVDESIFEEEEDFEADGEEVEESFNSDDDSEKVENLESELAQYKEAVEYMKDKLHEVNILNAKLLFTNKLFKQYSLDNNQKLKVVETFDRAHTTREIKLVYSTLSEQFGENGSITRKYSIKESASSVIGSTKSSKQSRKVITEEEQTANRFRHLAGIINK